MIVGSGVEIGHGQLLLGLQLAAKLLVLAFEELAAAKVIQGAVLSGGHEPGAGIIRDAGFGPLLEGGDERVLGEFFR
jgi:hypothetical protein